MQEQNNLDVALRRAERAYAEAASRWGRLAPEAKTALAYLERLKEHQKAERQL